MPDDARPILVLDGDLRAELARRGVVLRPTPGDLPLPIREPAAVRSLHVDVARAGADVLTAPTGNLHRRSLARIGAARRVQEWVAVALELAREAAEMAAEDDRPGRDREPRPSVRVAGLIHPLEGLQPALPAPDFATAAAEHRAHVGALADAGADLLRIEGMAGIAESEAATRAAVETGLETWTGVAVDASGLALPSGEPLEAWATAIAPLRPAALLVAGPTLEATCAALAALAAFAGTAFSGTAFATPGAGATASAGLSLGGDLPLLAADRRVDDALPAGQTPETAATLPPGPDRREGASDPAARLIDAGAVLLSAGADGSPSRVAQLRAAADRELAAWARRRHAAREHVLAWIAQAAERAFPGPAVWLAPPSPDLPLPGAFAWQIVEAAELRRIPAGRYRLAVVPQLDTAVSGADFAPAAVRLLVDALEPGAWLLVEGDRAAALLTTDERIGALQAAPLRRSDAPSWLARRRP